MNAKEYLQRIRSLDKQIKNKKLEIEDIKNKMLGSVAISYEPKIGVSGAVNTKSPQEKYLCICIEYEEELAQDVDNLMLLKREAMRLIDQIDDADCIDLLYKRYFQFMKWEQIAVEKNYSYQGILKLHGRALQKFDRILKECTRVYIE